VAEAERVRARSDGTNGALLDADGVADRLHLERIGHDQPVEPELRAKEVVKDLAAHRRRHLPERAHHDMCGHDREHAGLDRSAEGHERLVLEHVHRRKREVRVERRVAVAREVLRAGGDPGCLEALDGCRDMTCDEIAFRPERANADHGVLRVRVDVGDRREVEVDPDAGKLGAHRRRDAPRQLDVVDGTESGVPRVRAPTRGLEPRDVTALLVDRDDEVVPFRAQLARQRRELLSALDVPRVEDDAAEPLVETAAHPVRHRRSREPRKDAARREALEVRRCHALTAPAVRPKAIFRWTRRKKITTGIAVSVDAAISPPQSVARLVP
jgi:hypothetical protein